MSGARAVLWAAAVVATSGARLGSDKLKAFQELTRDQLSGLIELPELPMIVVIGDQSSGKSSLLNAMLKEIGSPAQLPTAKDFCTRMPTVLTMFSGTQNLVTLTGADGTKIKITSNVKQSIDTEVKKMVDKGGYGAKGIIKMPMDMDVETTGEGSVEGNLVLVDLPGIAIAGDHLQDTIDLTKEYVAKRNAVLVVVSEHTIGDRERILALKFAQEKDPKDERTLRVINVKHLDSVPKVTGSSFDAATVITADYLSPHAVIPAGPMEGAWIEGVPQNRQGVGELMKRLQQLLWERVELSLPEAKRSVEAKIAQAKLRLKDIGEEPPPPEELTEKLTVGLLRLRGGTDNKRIIEQHLTPVFNDFKQEMMSQTHDANGNSKINDEMVESFRKDNSLALPMFQGERVVQSIMRSLYTNWTAVVKEFLPKFQKAALLWLGPSSLQLGHSIGHRELAEEAYTQISHLINNCFHGKCYFRQSDQTVAEHPSVNATIQELLDRHFSPITNEVHFAEVAGYEGLLYRYEEMLHKSAMGTKNMRRSFENELIPNLGSECKDELRAAADDRADEDTTSCLLDQMLRHYNSKLKDSLKEQEVIKIKAATSAWAVAARETLVSGVMGIILNRPSDVGVQYITFQSQRDEKLKSIASQEEPRTKNERADLKAQIEKYKNVEHKLRLLQYETTDPSFGTKQEL